MGRIRVVYGLAAIGFALRFVLAWLSRGSNDADTWEQFAWVISRLGLRSLYEGDEWFTHPPLMGAWAYLCFRLAEVVRVPLPALLKLAPIAGDVGTGVLLWRIWRHTRDEPFGVPLFAWALLLYAFDLAAILISGYHGNNDSLCAMFCLWAFWLQQERRPLATGLALAGALDVKLLPILCVPLLLLQQRTLRDAGRFSLGLLVGLAPFLYLVPSAGIMLHRMLGYGSNLERWGVVAVLELAAGLPALVPTAAQSAYHEHGRYLLLAIFLGLGLLQRLRPRWSGLELGALAFSAFLLFAPGFGIQYVVYPVPFFHALRLRLAAAYGTTAGLFAAALYLAFWTGDSPWFSRFTGAFPTPAALLGIVPWLLLGWFFVGTLARGLGGGPPTTNLEAAPAPAAR